MISLKKNDKIIIIVAVVILVIAGVGVAMYQSPEAPTDYSSLITSEKSYNVTWNLRNGTLKTLSDFAGKKTPYEGTVAIPESNVNSITFNLSWTDDHMTFLKRMGLDSFTLDVSMPDGMTSFSETDKSAPKTGFGTISYTIVNNIIPPDGPIKAENEQDAQKKLQTSPYFDDSWTDKDIKINVSCHIGELRFLKKMRDKGNDFELKISYQYYEGALKLDTTKNTGGNSDMPPDDFWTDEQITQPPYISMIISTGCGRYI
jgi:hypothetical protein